MNIDLVLTLLMYVFGPVISLVITGFLFDRLVLRKVFRNKKVKETLDLFNEGTELLRKIVEEQKRKRQTSA